MKLLLVTLLLLFPLISSAGVYRWVDENGNTHFGTKPKPEKQQKTPPKLVKIKPSPSIKKTKNTVAAPNKAATARPHTATKASPITSHPRAVQKAVSAPVSVPTLPVAAPIVTTSTAAPKITKTVEPVLRAIPTPARKASKPTTPKPAAKTVKKTAKKVKKKKALQTTKVKKPANKSPALKPAAKKTAPSTPVTKANNDKNPELCGLFTTKISDYQNKLIDCQAVACAVYEKALSKYRKKQERYCP